MTRLRWFAAIALIASCSACGGNGAASTAATPVIARVGNIAILSTTYQARLQAAKTALEQSGAPSGGAMEAQLETNVVQSLIADAAIEQMAKQRGVAATTAMINAGVKADVTAAGGMSSLETQLVDAGGSLTQLRDEVASQLNESLLENVMAQQRAAMVEADLAAGQNFATLAKEYSDDSSSAPNGGDLGVVTDAQISQIDTSLKVAAHKLTVGQYTTTPVRDSEGYDIIGLLGMTSTGLQLERILISAYQPYTVQNRPQWFTVDVLARIGQLCAAKQVEVFIQADSDPCTVDTPVASPSPSS